MNEDPRNDHSPNPDPGDQRTGDPLSGGAGGPQSAQQLPPAGWYADPHPQGTGQRFWDGARWTHQTRPDPAAAPAPAQPPYGQDQSPYDPYGQGRPPYGGYAPQPGGYPQPQQGDHQNPWRSQAGFGYPTGRVTADGVRLGGWGARFVALLIDGVLMTVLQVVVLQVFFGDITDAMLRWEQDVMSAVSSGSTNYPSSPADPVYGVTAQWYLYRVLVLLLGFAYFTLLMRFRGASLGQQAMGLRVVPAEHGRGPVALPWSTSLLRNGVWYAAALVGLVPVTFISLLGPLFQMVDIIYGLANGKRQTLHDRFARTQVISTRP